jgi:hypothetical protein
MASVQQFQTVEELAEFEPAIKTFHTIEAALDYLRKFHPGTWVTVKHQDDLLNYRYEVIHASKE